MNAVIFDMDGVIFDTERIWIECWSPVGRAHGIRGIEKVLRDECVGITAAAMKAILQKTYGEDFPYEQYVKEATAVLRARYGHKLPMKPGVKDVLEFLRASGAPVAMASSTGTKTIREELGEAGLLPFFQIRRWFRLLDPEKRRSAAGDIAAVRAVTAQDIRAYDRLLSDLGFSK